MPIQDGKPMPIQGEDADKGPRPHFTETDAVPQYLDMMPQITDRKGPHFTGDIATVQTDDFTRLQCNSTTYVVDGTQVFFRKSTESSVIH